MIRTFDMVRGSGKHSGLGSQGSLNSLGYGGSVHSTPTHHPHTPSHMATTHMTNSGSGYAMSYLSSRGSSIYSGGSGHPSLDSGADSDASMHTDSEDNYPLVLWSTGRTPCYSSAPYSSSFVLCEYESAFASPCCTFRGMRCFFMFAQSRFYCQMSCTVPALPFTLFCS